MLYAQTTFTAKHHGMMRKKILEDDEEKLVTGLRYLVKQQFSIAKASCGCKNARYCCYVFLLF